MSTIVDGFDEFIQGIKARRLRGKPNLPTGIPWLDDITDGVREGKMWVIASQAGGGKCLAKGTKVMMYDGTIKSIEDIKTGEAVMGDDGNMRMVLGTTQGVDEMYKVTPVKGKPYIVNSCHILSLKHQGKVIDISIEDYKNKSKTFKKNAKGYRVGYDAPGRTMEIDPYFLGLWLGDGTSENQDISNIDFEVEEYLKQYAKDLGLRLHTFKGRTCYNHRISNHTPRTKIDKCSIIGCKNTKGIVQGLCRKHYSRFYRSGFLKAETNNILLDMMREYNLLNNKHIPLNYKVNNRENKLQLLAGLIDSDGYMHHNNYEYVTKLPQLRDDVLYLCRSLSLAAYSSDKIIDGKVYYRISISGDCSVVPVKIARKKAGKRKQIKDVLVTGITVKHIGKGEYAGFELSDNGRFLLEDFTVTHNTSIAMQIARNISDDPTKHVLFISLEMTRAELMGRMFCETYKLDYGKVRNGKPIPDFLKYKSMFEEYMCNINLDVVDDKGYNYKEIIEVIQEQYAHRKPDVIFIDYLQLISTAGHRDERQGLDEFLRSMVEKCKKANIALVLMSQLRRPPSGVTVNKAPENVDLKGSGKIEQDAFVVLFTYRTRQMSGGVYEDKIFLKVSKNRDGVTDEREFNFKGESFHFSEKTMHFGKDNL